MFCFLPAVLEFMAFVGCGLSKPCPPHLSVPRFLTCTFSSRGWAGVPFRIDTAWVRVTRHCHPAVRNVTERWSNVEIKFVRRLPPISYKEHITNDFVHSAVASLVGLQETARHHQAQKLVWSCCGSWKLSSKDAWRKGTFGVSREKKCKRMNCPPNERPRDQPQWRGLLYLIASPRWHMEAGRPQAWVSLLQVWLVMKLAIHLATSLGMH